MLARLGARVPKIAHTRNESARKIERTVIHADHALHDVGVCRVFVCKKRRDDCGQRCPIVGLECCDRSGNQFGFDFRLITLHIHDDLCIDIGDRFTNATRSIGMIRSSHHATRSKCKRSLADQFIVGCDNDFLDSFAECGAFPHMLQQ